MNRYFSLGSLHAAEVQQFPTELVQTENGSWLVLACELPGIVRRNEVHCNSCKGASSPPLRQPQPLNGCAQSFWVLEGRTASS